MCRTLCPSCGGHLAVSRGGSSRSPSAQPPPLLPGQKHGCRPQSGSPSLSRRPLLLWERRPLATSPDGPLPMPLSLTALGTLLYLLGDTLGAAYWPCAL